MPFTAGDMCRKEVTLSSTSSSVSRIPLGSVLKEQTMHMWVPCMRERRQGLGLLLPLLKDSSKDMRTRLPFSFVLFEHSELFPFSGLCQGL